MRQFEDAKVAFEKARELLGRQVSSDEVEKNLQEVTQVVNQNNATKKQMKQSAAGSSVASVSPEEVIFRDHNRPETAEFMNSLMGRIDISQNEYNHWLSIERIHLDSLPVLAEPDVGLNVNTRLLDVLNQTIASIGCSPAEAEVHLFEKALAIRSSAYASNNNGLHIGTLIGIGCNATAFIVSHLCVDFTDMRAAQLMAPPLLSIEKTLKVARPIWVSDSAVLSLHSDGQAIEDLEAFRTSKEPVLYTFYIPFYGNAGNLFHCVSVIQVPTSNESRYRVIQSYGLKYSLTDWLNGNIKSPFQGWMDRRKTKRLFSHCLSTALSSYNWLVRSAHQLAFACDIPNGFSVKDKANLWYCAIPFNWDSFNAKLDQLTK